MSNVEADFATRVLHKHQYTLWHLFATIKAVTNSMTAAEFKLLCEEKQRDSVMRNGVMVAQMEYDFHKIFLFQIDSFYVEFFFSLHSNELEWHNVFEETELLSPYLEQIDITDAL
ncbi:MAG TPA: hypothetical protein VEZ55_06860 [Chitinophagaceae bacterium]|nr:hypothetical protein [Chitinophagaceae bacterium]